MTGFFFPIKFWSSMKISSFIDTIATDRNYTLVEFATISDEFTGEREYYYTNITGEHTPAWSTDAVKNLRTRIHNHLRDNYFLVDCDKKKIFTNVTKDPFISRMTANIDCKIIHIEHDRLWPVIKKMIPDAVVEEKKGGCFLL